MALLCITACFQPNHHEFTLLPCSLSLCPKWWILWWQWRLHLLPRIHWAVLWWDRYREGTQTGGWVGCTCGCGLAIAKIWMWNKMAALGYVYTQENTNFSISPNAVRIRLPLDVSTCPHIIMAGVHRCTVSWLGRRRRIYMWKEECGNSDL